MENLNKLLESAIRLFSHQERSDMVLNHSLDLDPSSPKPSHPAVLQGYNIFFARVT